MKKRRRIDYREHETPDPEELPETSGTASANECTGLMYRTPRSDQELEAYRELTPMEIPNEAEKRPE